jgi:hypothetical protein
MDLGVRQIRTAGRGSGSIELTLPTDLRDLVGLPCRIILRDGSRPDIVLQPDLRRAHQAFSDMWQAMATALLQGDVDVPTLPLATFDFGLHPRSGGGDRPFLCWRDGLTLAAAAPHDPTAVSRTLAAFAHAMAGLLKIDATLAFAFGVTCGFLVAGVPPTSQGQEACDIAAVALRLAHPQEDLSAGRTMLSAPASATACIAGVADPVFWCYATPLLTAAIDLFMDWTADPSNHAALRAAWRRGRTIEMGGD